MEDIVVIGGGGHGKVLLGVLKRLDWRVLGYTDAKDRGTVLGAQYLGDDAVLPQLVSRGCRWAIVGVGKVDASSSRTMLQEGVSAMGLGVPVIVSPSAVVNEEVELGPGTVIFDGAVVNSGVIAGRACIVNSNSTVEHDCLLGDNVHVASGATVSGGVSIGSDCMIGAGATVVQGVRICAGTLVGAGAVVMHDIEEPGTYVGGTGWKSDMIPSDGTFIIAEAGVNHNGSLELAMRLVDEAHRAGADAVKFQTFRADRLVARSAKKAEYQRRTTGGEDTQYEMLRRLELDEDAHRALLAASRKAGIMFLSSPFDDESADLLEELEVPIFKLPSGELTNHPLLRHVATKGRPIILSTGMATLEEVREAVDVMTGAADIQLSLLHCVTEYPAPYAEVNLRAMQTLRDAFGLPVGYSDHTLGSEVALAAVALGATILEKHFTLDRSLPGPDHAASLEPQELAEVIRAVRHVEQALGDGVKGPAPCEVKNIAIARKSVVAERDLDVGHRVIPEDVAVKRPGDGIAPRDLGKVIGRTVARRVKTGDVLRWKDLTEP